MFKEGRELVEDEHHVGRPSTARTDAQVGQGKNDLDSDRGLTIALISEETGLSVGTIHTIVTEEMCAKLVRYRVTHVRSAIAKNWKLHNDNVVWQLLPKFVVVALPNPPYCPDPR